MAIYAQETLDTINRTKTAVVNKTYESINGNRYIGKVGGFLELIEPLDIEAIITPVTVGRTPLPPGASTADLQTAGNDLLAVIDTSINSLADESNTNTNAITLNQYTQLDLLNLMYEELQAQTKLLKKIYQ